MTPVADRIVYVAGPFSGADAWQREQNVRRAEDVAAQLWAAGVPTICVHSTARILFGHVPEAVALAADLVLLRACHAVALAPGWTRSNGTIGEMREAFGRGMPIFAPEAIDACIRFAHTGETHGELDSTWWVEKGGTP